MSRTLQPQDRISHYRVLGPLGAGGMGEVYIAQDETLERSVALKVLPAHLVQNEERVRRFITEAKSASSLNHPHIITIYEIGQEQVLSGEGEEAEPGSAPIHFISMELVTGETLTHKIHGEKTGLRTLLGYLAQAAEGLAKAHNAGIIHRDLKPANIMISKDGYAKVLDFGLAKLTEKHAAEDGASSAPTELDRKTAEGMVMGTVGYMAPEQVRGKAVDHRADMFAFGCILYESATRKRPFVADTDVETMHLILNEKAPPVEDLNPEVPTEVRRIIRRCLAKNPDQRFQSMKDLAIELREIVEEYDDLTASGTSAMTGVSGAAATSARSGMGLKLGIAAAVIIGVVGITVGVRGLMTGGGSTNAVPKQPFESVKFSNIFSRPDLGAAVLSPDGRYLAYRDGPTGHRNLKIRQVNTGSDVTILADQETSAFGISFSADGDYLYYLARDLEAPAYRALYQVASLGGTPTKKVFDIDSGASFAPDSVQLAFRRGKPDLGRDTITIANLETSEEREFASVDLPRTFVNEPAWSPDGKKIAAAEFSRESGVEATISIIDVESTEKTILGDTPWIRIQNISWTPDNTAVIVAAADPTTSNKLQIWYVSYPGGVARKITNDLDTYTEIGITSDGKTITAVRTTREANAWTVEAKAGPSPRQLTFGAGSSNAVSGIRPAANDVVIFNQAVGGLAQIWTMNLDGSGRRQLTSGKFAAFGGTWVPQGEFLVFMRTVSDTDRAVHIWRVDLDGGNMKQITRGTGEDLMGVSRDGKWIYVRKTDTDSVLFRVSVDGGELQEFLKPIDGGVAQSPDGKLLWYGNLEQDGERWRTYIRVIPAEGGPPVVEFFPVPGNYGVRWTPDGTGVTLSRRSDGGRGLYRSDLGEKNVERILSLDDGRIIDHSWSTDGTQIHFHKRVGSTDSIWIVPAAGGKPQLLTQFPTGSISSHRWTLDDRHILFAHGRTTREVVQIREAAQATN